MIFFMDSLIQSLQLYYNTVDNKMREDFLSIVKENYDDYTYNKLMQTIELDEYAEKL